MTSNKAFGIYVVALCGGVLSVITASVMAGVTTLPTFLTLVEHVSISLLFRAAYKSFDGPYDLIGLIRGQQTVPTAESTAATSTMAGAAS